MFSADEATMSGTELAPRTRRRRLSASLTAAALALVVSLAASACTPANEAQDLMNNDRVANGLWALPAQTDIYIKAQNWSEQMARNGRISHSNLTSGLPAGWQMAGENVGCGSSLASIERSFMNSSGHRANILNRSYTHAANGVARGTCTTSSGAVIKDAYFVTQVFVKL